MQSYHLGLELGGCNNVAVLRVTTILRFHCVYYHVLYDSLPVQRTSCYLQAGYELEHNCMAHTTFHLQASFTFLKTAAGPVGHL